MLLMCGVMSIGPVAPTLSADETKPSYKRESSPVTAAATLPAPRLEAAADKALSASTVLWFAMALIGQWTFLYYIVVFYGPSTFTGDFEAWTQNAMLKNAYVAGDTAGNLTFAAHALLAGVIAFGGALQLIPQVRARAPAFHRWNGRLFLVTAVGLSLAGFYLVWVRDTDRSPGSSIAITINGLLIIGFAGLAWRAARARAFAAHRRWALRLYLVSNAQWFMRVGFFAWFMISRPLLGEVKGLDQQFFLAWTFGCYLVPLAVLELYLRAKEGGSPRWRLAMAGGLFGLTLLMGTGMAGFTVFSLRILSGAPVSF